MSMFKSKPEFKRMPQVQQYYDVSDTFGVASRRKQIEDMKLRIEEAENRAKNIRLKKKGYNIKRNRFFRDSLTILTDS